MVRGVRASEAVGTVFTKAKRTKGLACSQNGWLAPGQEQKHMKSNRSGRVGGKKTPQTCIYNVILDISVCMEEPMQSWD
jgi:hypothetical protein